MTYLQQALCKKAGKEKVEKQHVDLAFKTWKHVLILHQTCFIYKKEPYFCLKCNFYKKGFSAEQHKSKMTIVILKNSTAFVFIQEFPLQYGLVK